MAMRQKSKPQEIDIKIPSEKESRVKMMRSIANTGYMNVWEGSIRSGKTFSALLSFAVHCIESDATIFLMTGRTVGTIERNAILSDYGLLNIMGLGSDAYGRFGESKAIKFSVNRDGNIIQKKIIVLGGNDQKSYKALRGVTLHSVFCDEANMVDKDFFAECLNRTALAPKGCRKHFITLNPDNPKHWLYEEYLDHYDAMTKAERKALGGYYYWHFVPKDNPAMTKEMLESLDMMYPHDSFLYRRYVLGERCVAEGLIFPEFTDMYFRDFPKDEVKKTDIRYCAIDFGANHPTTMVFGGTYEGNTQDWRIVREYFDEKSGKTTYDHYKAFLEICKELDVNPQKITIAIDPAALTLRTEFINRGLNVIKAKNDVLPGIEYLRRIVVSGHLLFSSSMTGFRRELDGYRWDEKASERGEDKPIKIGDDVCDAVRYFAFTFVRNFVR